jgi:hypothetical protein
MDNKMPIENSDIAYRSTTNTLVGLFSELEGVVSRPLLFKLLNTVWTDDELATLKIIFNSRSIHLGKSSVTLSTDVLAGFDTATRGILSSQEVRDVVRADLRQVQGGLVRSARGGVLVLMMRIRIRGRRVAVIRGSRRRFG